MKYGPKTETIESFLRHLRCMGRKEWNAVGDVAKTGGIAWDAAWDTAWGNAWVAAGAAARDATGDAGGAAAWDAVMAAAWAAAGGDTVHAAGAAAGGSNEIQGAELMREPFYFLPLFGFANPEAVLAADKE
jgi:hypothetical protein